MLKRTEHLFVLANYLAIMIVLYCIALHYVFPHTIKTTELSLIKNLSI